jgi:hypothetical protein
VEALVALVFVAGSPLQTASPATEQVSQVAGRTILPKVSFDIPRGTTLETFASRSVRKGKIALSDAGKTTGEVIGIDWKPLDRLGLMPIVVGPVTAGCDKKRWKKNRCLSVG